MSSAVENPVEFAADGLQGVGSLGFAVLFVDQFDRLGSDPIAAGLSMSPMAMSRLRVWLRCSIAASRLRNGEKMCGPRMMPTIMAHSPSLSSRVVFPK